MAATVTPAEPAQALTFEETRARLRVGRSTLFRLIADDRIPSFKLGRSRRFLAADVDQFLHSIARD
jgi:excisionase family DNA binding protein